MRLFAGRKGRGFTCVKTLLSFSVICRAPAVAFSAAGAGKIKIAVSESAFIDKRMAFII